MERVGIVVAVAVDRPEVVVVPVGRTPATHLKEDSHPHVRAALSPQCMRVSVDEGPVTITHGDG